jgi:hypothetical protein
MWVNLTPLKKMISIYNESDFVNEIIIIDNNTKDKIDLNFKKLKTLTKNENIYVNPAWNWGVSESKTQKIIIANDDILIENFEETIIKIDEVLKDKIVIGLNTTCFNGEKEKVSIIKCKEKRPHGWGTFIAMNKKSYIVIPEYLKIWVGDDIQFYNNDAYMILGACVKTRMSETIKKYNLKDMARKDFQFYKTKCNLDGSLK